ncbi:hypothetical protein SADFL11_88 (plasmid) [Roseibium alexandrii DFL-11]|uniref:Uncharacterized protein n=1 Tax=Roseibium alexandrii (strain DSM 17067 / NCIMB 14079 / DFL-11) TaxID=244592 RepID=A0A5E8H7X7_ROSAD|nr:hypothetical protein SADFL11_88 [Roseibium alexandrii DFL-11]
MAAGDGLEGRLEIGEELHAVNFRGLDEGCDAATFVMAGGKGFLPVQCNWPDQIPDAVAIDLDTANVKEGL